MIKFYKMKDILADKLHIDDYYEMLDLFREKDINIFTSLQTSKINSFPKTWKKDFIEITRMASKEFDITKPTMILMHYFNEYTIFMDVLVDFSKCKLDKMIVSFKKLRSFK